MNKEKSPQIKLQTYPKEYRVLIPYAHYEIITQTLSNSTFSKLCQFSYLDGTSYIIIYIKIKNKNSYFSELKKEFNKNKGVFYDLLYIEKEPFLKTKDKKELAWNFRCLTKKLPRVIQSSIDEMLGTELGFPICCIHQFCYNDIKDFGYRRKIDNIGFILCSEHYNNIMNKSISKIDVINECKKRRNPHMGEWMKCNVYTIRMRTIYYLTIIYGDKCVRELLKYFHCIPYWNAYLRYRRKINNLNNF